ncbi:MAG: hypothetical protein KY469_02540 [Actinobacteria bacterium]|nr:hypothetical protein [Actinomycetota bacterium]
MIAFAACSDDGGEHRWRDARITAPDGWVVHEEAATHFALTDAPLGTGEEPGPGVVGAFFTYEPSTTPDDWRELASDQGWAILEDEAIEVGGVPATRLVIDQSEQQVPTREMVVVIPSKGIVVLFQPTPTVDQTDGVERFERWRATFDTILSDLRFGAPVRDGALARGGER